MMNSLEIRDLTFTYPGAKTPTLNHVELKIEKGDFIAIVGNNGCGKSTLCKAMNGLIPHFISGIFEGTVLAGGGDTKTAGLLKKALKEIHALGGDYVSILTSQIDE